jgi:hypothetical protein
MAATLGVETIQHTNGTTAVTVGTNGSVTAAGTLGVTGLTSLTTMNTTGNVGIRTGSPTGILNVKGTGGDAMPATSGSTQSAGLITRLQQGGGIGSVMDIGGNGGSGSWIQVTESGNLAANYKLLLNPNGGSVLIGTTAALSFASSAPIQVLSSGIAGAFKNTTAGSQTISVYNTGNSGTRYLMWFESNASKTHVGSITSNGSATAYNTSSDYRLKENVVYDWDATTRLKQLKPARFNFIVDETNTPVDGFLAHEAQVVVPECVTGTKDEVDDNDVAVMQGIDQSKLVPLLVKTIQELEARITALEA